VSQKKRNPRYFPKMKVRGSHNRDRYEIDVWQGHLERLNVLFTKLISDVNQSMNSRGGTQ